MAALPVMYVAVSLLVSAKSDYHNNVVILCLPPPVLVLDYQDRDALLLYLQSALSLCRTSTSHVR